MNISPSTQKSSRRLARPPAREGSSVPDKVVVSAYIDGKSEHIEAMKLSAVARFEKAQEASSGRLKVVLDGQRHTFKSDALKFTALGLAPAAATAAVGAQLAGTVGGVIGGVAGLTLFALPCAHFLHRSLKAGQWQDGTRLPLGGKAEPSPVSEPGPQRLRNLVDTSKASNPQARQILFLSGHGSIDEIAHMPWSKINESMKGSKLDATILDACLTSQLEVVSQMAPWAGLIMASPHKIKARGLELPKMLAPEHLEKTDLRESVVEMAKEARSTTPSWVVLDGQQIQKQFLPSLDELGKGLVSELRNGKRGDLKKVLAKSLSTDGLVSSRVDMGSFLKNLKDSGLAPEQTTVACQSFQDCVPFQKNQHTMSFHLKKGRQEESLPQGWRDFLSELDIRFKPLF